MHNKNLINLNLFQVPNNSEILMVLLEVRKEEDDEKTQDAY